MGQTFDIFQQSGNAPVCRDWLNREHNDSESSTDNSQRIALLILSGPNAFPARRYFKTTSISAGVRIMELNSFTIS